VGWTRVAELKFRNLESNSWKLLQWSPRSTPNQLHDSSAVVRLADAITRLTLLFIGVLRLATRPRLSWLCYHPLSPPSWACAKYNWRLEFVTSDHVLREYVRGVPHNFLLIGPRNNIWYLPPPSPRGTAFACFPRRTRLDK
jgi:hypothetical protein